MRIESSRIAEKRAARSSRILVTGGTGFLGSHMAAALLGAGYRVAVLARSTKALSARARIERVADWLGLDEDARSRLTVIEGNILDPGWAAAAAEAGSVDEIVHCASNTRFAERKRAEIEAANIGGLRNVLDFAVRSGCGFFHHVSTAFVAGRRTGPCPEDWVEAGPFTNVYEETKAKGEIQARDLCRREGLRLSVYRPTIVTGDSRTGRTLRFNALYFPIKAAVYLRDIYLADIRDRGGRRAAELGIRPAEDGRLIMPLRIEIGGGGINLVPVDHFIATFMAVFEDGLDGGIYHIASAAPTRLEDIVAYTKRFFRLEGIGTCGPESFAGRPRNALEILYESYLETYRPYMQEARSFEVANAAPMLARRGLVCPAFDYDVFGRCMAYALDADWGSKLFAR